MSVRCKEIIALMETIAPLENACKWDNVGLLVGDDEATIERVLVALDVSDEVIDEAITLGAGLIISHHPVIFKGISHINNKTPLGRKILKLITNNIGVYSSHTNLDYADLGTNASLMKLLQLNKVERLEQIESTDGVMRAGMLAEPIKLADFAQEVKRVLSTDSIRFVGNGDSLVQKIAVCTGSASGSAYFAEALEASCDVYITGDVRFHEAQEAMSMGLSLIDATHYGSEVVGMAALKETLVRLGKEKELSFMTTLSKWNGKLFTQL